MAKAIRDALIADGVSQIEFSRRVGCTPKHINQVIRGSSTAHPSQLDLWAFTLGRRWKITLEDLWAHPKRGDERLEAADQGQQGTGRAHRVAKGLCLDPTCVCHIEG